MNALAKVNAIAPTDAISIVSVFSRVPAGCNVVEMGGAVVIYDQDTAQYLPLEDGQFYVMEHQRPIAGMSWETARLFSSRRINTEREVVRVFQRPSLTGDLWWYSHSNGRGPKFDGPMEDYNLADMMVGKVVGLYGPVGDIEVVAA